MFEFLYKTFDERRDHVLKTVKYFEKGVLTSWEALGQIREFHICEPCFLELLSLVPSKLIEELKEDVCRGPFHPEEVNHNGACITWVEGYTPPEDWDDPADEFRLRTYWAARRLREILAPDFVEPEFQTILSAGHITVAFQTSLGVVVEGFYIKFPRRHPIHLVSPEGHKTITRILRRFWTEDYPQPEKDRLDAMSETEEYIAYGYLLDANVTSPDMVPPGTEVLIDRTAAKDPLPCPLPW